MAPTKPDIKRQYNFLRDRECSECGETIWNQTTFKPRFCPSCKKNLRFRSQSFTDPSIRRCDNCDCYIHVDDSFCMVCKFGNAEAIRNKRIKVEIDARKMKVESDAKIRKLEAELKKKSYRLQILEDAAKDAAEKSKIAEEEQMVQKHLGEIDESMLDDDEAFLVSPNTEQESDILNAA